MRDRIKEFKRVPASSLKANKSNWRTHSTAQREVLEGLLQEIGFAGCLIVREIGDDLRLIDGHLRQDLAGDSLVPVLVLDVTDDEEKALLATFDPVAAMAGAEHSILDNLIEEVRKTSNAAGPLLDELQEVKADKLESGWRNTANDDESSPKNVVVYLALGVGDLDDWDAAVRAVALPGETQGETVLRVLHARGTKTKQPSGVQSSGSPPSARKSKR